MPSPFNRSTQTHIIDRIIAQPQIKQAVAIHFVWLLNSSDDASFEPFGIRFFLRGINPAKKLDAAECFDKVRRVAKLRLLSGYTIFVPTQLSQRRGNQW